MKKLVSILGLLLLTACAGGPPPMLTAEPPPAGKSRLTITRTTDLLYLGAAARIDVNGSRIGEIGRGGATQTVVDPGRVTVSTDAWSAPGRFTIALNAQPNTDYLLEVSPRSDSMTAGMMMGLGGQAMEAGGPFQIVVKEARPRQ